MRRFYFFRHGETDFNREQRFQGHLDIPLNEQGRRQAQELAQSLKHLGIECLLSSDLSRARETAEIVARGLAVPVFETSNLREAHLGDAQGLTTAEIELKFGSQLVEKWRSPFLSDADVSYPGGETGRQVLERVLGAMVDFDRPHLTVGVATHGGVIRRLVRSLLKDSDLMIPIPNGIVYAIDQDLQESHFTLVSTMPWRK
ncbi:MAG: hypothetical protein RJB38_904 [Pseudomonadota bacterium]|jgi:broad specificity phosphatase PhoE